MQKKEGADARRTPAVHGIKRQMWFVDRGMWHTDRLDRKEGGRKAGV